MPVAAEPCSKHAPAARESRLLVDGSVTRTMRKRAVSRIVHVRCTKKTKELMSTTPPFGVETGIKLNRGQIPAFTAGDMQAYPQTRPSCRLGPTHSGEPPTVESIEFATCRELRDRLHMDIGLFDDAPACFVALRGPFLLTVTDQET
jgi:hypothetical protein